MEQTGTVASDEWVLCTCRGLEQRSQYVKLYVVPVELKEANALVKALHRHHRPVVGHRFSLGTMDDRGVLRGVAICGRPVARTVSQRNVLEVLRLCTDGTKNACSILYAAAARAAQAIGYKKAQTYILDSESGKSLEAAGWVDEGEAGGGDWNKPSRGGRRRDQPMEKKRRYAKYLNDRGDLKHVDPLECYCGLCG
jgi:hypothetical protein